jgi:dTDP-4-dehydrorhamnose 3,5-epimerase
MANEPSVARALIRSQEDVTVLGQRNGLKLAIKRRTQRTLGDIITKVQCADLIADVVIEPLQVLADDRGLFAELARLGSAGSAEGMIPDGKRRIQVSTTLTYPGTIKAIHYHYEQTDLWAPIAGMLQVFLCDLRCDSASFGAINTLYVGSLRPWKILIPPGVAHGYKVLGTEPAQLVYLTDRYYNPEDEGRLPYNHPDVAYDWETQHK